MAETRREFLERGARLGAALALSPALRLARDARRPDPAVRALARAVRGAVLTPASPSYDTARRVVNSRFDDVYPRALVRPLDAPDVQAVVRWAQETRVPIVARAGGHSYGGYSTTSGAVVDLSALAHVSLDAQGHATVGAGARLGDLYAALGARGRAISAGSCPSVGIGGLALGGGFGLASRAWGLTCDDVLELEIVTADGRLLTCDAARHPDLFWACRGGGGGNFGIVTRFVFRTHPVDTGSWFVATFPWTEVEAVVARYLEWGPSAPDELGPVCRLAAGTTPSVQVLGQHLGPETELQAQLALLTDGLALSSLRTGSSPWLDLVRRWANCADALHACAQPVQIGFAAGSDYFTRPLPAGGLAALRLAVEGAGPVAASLLLDVYGGAIGRIAPDATAFVHRRMLALCQYYAIGDAHPTQAWVRAARTGMAPYASGFAYQNYIDPQLASWEHAYYGSNLPRLRAVKRRYDPHGLFRFAQGIRSA